MTSSMETAREALETEVLGSVGTSPSPTGETGGGSDAAETWHRIGGLLYTLEQVGWRRGEPVMSNRLMVRVEVGRDVPDEVADELTARVHAFLSAQVPTSQPVGEGFMPTEPNTSNPPPDKAVLGVKGEREGEL